MKKMSLLIVVLTLSVAGGFASMAAKVFSLASLVNQFELEKSALTASNRHLVDKNSELERQRKSTRKLLAQHRAKMVGRGVERAAKRIARAGAAMIPVVGISSVAVATADEIEDLCTDIQVVRELEMSLYEIDPSQPVKKESYCRQELAKELALQADDLRQQLVKMTESLVDASYREVFEIEYAKLVDYWSRKLAELAGDQSADSGTTSISELKEDPL